MIERLIKDYKNTDNPVVRNRYGNAAGIVGICTNLLLGAFKLIIGFASNSVSIMADAVNNITDMATSALTIVGFKLSSKKPTKEHPYGYARYEYVSGFVIALFMFVMGLIFAKESFTKIIHPEELTINAATYIILSFAVVAKFIQMMIYRKFAKAINSKTIEATALDSKNDIITSSGILLSMIVMGYFKINIDGYVGFAISILVIISSIGAIKEELEPIIGIVPTQEQVDQISKKLTSYPVVHDIHDMMIHNYGVNNDFISVHVEVDASKDIMEIHDAIDIIENDFREEFGVLMTIHMDPVIIGNPKIDNIREQVSKALKDLDSRLMFHDFRMVEGPTHTNVIFDCVVPQDKDWDKAFFNSYLKEKIKFDGNLIFVVEIDRPFC